MAPRTEMAGPRWSSHPAFVLTAAGAAVGLGNLWRFPFMTGENGGGAFVIVYLAALALVGFPVMLAELMIGRRGRANAEPGRHGAMIAIRTTDMHAMVARLAERRIIASCRDGNLRISPHLYNTEADIDAALEAIAANRGLLQKEQSRFC